jgi:hypothetical protein
MVAASSAGASLDDDKMSVSAIGLMFERLLPERHTLTSNAAAAPREDCLSHTSLTQ